MLLEIMSPSLSGPIHFVHARRRISLRQRHIMALALPAAFSTGLVLPAAAPLVARTALRTASPVAQVVDDKAEVTEYFNNEGFNRWSRIYSEDGEVNSVQLDIRTGHAQTVDKVLKWVDADGSAKAGNTFCDAGCGVGSLALPLAERGASVVASDISDAMVTEASSRAQQAGLSGRCSFSTSDLEALSVRGARSRALRSVQQGVCDACAEARCHASCAMWGDGRSLCVYSFLSLQSSVAFVGPSLRSLAAGEAERS